MEQLNHTPEYNIDTPEIDEHYTRYERQAIICRFNYFWPKLVDLFLSIFTNSTTQCEIHLCSKGFFIVKFLSAIDRDIVIQEGPWFWGSTGLFITPWFLDFDANTWSSPRCQFGCGYTIAQYISGIIKYQLELEILLDTTSKWTPSEWRKEYILLHEYMWK